MQHPPEKISGLIRLAVADARGLNRELYSPHYGEWHTPERKGRDLPGMFRRRRNSGGRWESLADLT